MLPQLSVVHFFVENLFFIYNFTTIYMLGNISTPGHITDYRAQILRCVKTVKYLVVSFLPIIHIGPGV